MKTDKTLIQDNKFSFEEFIVHAKLHDVLITQRYSSNSKYLYQIELLFTEELTGEQYKYTDTIEQNKIRDLSLTEKFLHKFFGFYSDTYNSMYDFITEKVIQESDSARNKLSEEQTIENLPAEKQAQKAFESLKEI